MPWAKLKVGPKTVGLIDTETKRYKTTRHYPKHYSFVLNAYGIQKEVLDTLRDADVELIQLEERKGGRIAVYNVTVEDWVDHASTVTLNAKDGEQLFVALDELPKPVILKRTPCKRRLDCCEDGRRVGCVNGVSHYAREPHVCCLGHESVERMKAAPPFPQQSNDVNP